MEETPVTRLIVHDIMRIGSRRGGGGGGRGRGRAALTRQLHRFIRMQLISFLCLFVVVLCLLSPGAGPLLPQCFPSFSRNSFHLLLLQMDGLNSGERSITTKTSFKDHILEQTHKEERGTM